MAGVGLLSRLRRLSAPHETLRQGLIVLLLQGFRLQERTQNISVGSLLPTSN